MRLRATVREEDGCVDPILDHRDGGGEFGLSMPLEKRKEQDHPAPDLVWEMPSNQAQLHSGQRSGGQFNTFGEMLSTFIKREIHFRFKT